MGKEGGISTGGEYGWLIPPGQRRVGKVNDGDYPKGRRELFRKE